MRFAYAFLQRLSFPAHFASLALRSGALRLLPLSSAALQPVFLFGLAFVVIAEALDFGFFFCRLGFGVVSQVSGSARLPVLLEPRSCTNSSESDSSFPAEIVDALAAQSSIVLSFFEELVSDDCAAILHSGAETNELLAVRFDVCPSESSDGFLTALLMALNARAVFGLTPSKICQQRLWQKEVIEE